MSDLKKTAPNLLKIIDKIENNRVNIAFVWVEIETINTLFKQYKISPNKFKNRYAIEIIEYFIAVVREEKAAGDCPIMSKLVNYLLEKNITPKDVFDICMGLRRTLISFLFENKILKDSIAEVMDEIADLFDANLSGVLDIFTSFYESKQKSIQKSIIHQKKYHQILKIINFVNTKIIIVQNGRIIMGNKSFFEAVGVQNVKELYEKYKDGFCYMKEIECSYKNIDIKKAQEWIRNVYETKKPFKTDIYNQKHEKVFTYSGRITTLPDSDPIQYIITLNNIASHLEDELDIVERLSHDELTGLNSYSVFEHLVAKAQREAIINDKKLSLAIVDVPFLKEINEQQGYKIGDRVLKEVADDIRLHSDESMILSHLEGSRFGILIEYKSEQECYDWCCSLYLQLAKKPEKKTVSVTDFDLTENVNRLFMRAYDLADKSDSDSVLTDFENIDFFEVLPEQEQFTIRLHNVDKITMTMYYSELPVLTTNRLMSIDKEHITVKLSEKQLVVAKPSKKVYFNIPSFGDVKAKIAEVDTKNKLAKISDFRVDEHSPLERKKFRIIAEKDMIISIISKGPAQEGIVLDISDEYVAVKLRRRRNLQEGDIVSINMMLMLDDVIEAFDSDAIVQKVEKIIGGYKVVLHLNIDSSNKKMLNDYILKQQMRVIKELQNKIVVDYTI